ncbi:MAG TPA: PAS domain S-box protein [Longimicrobiales bacterium]
MPHASQADGSAAGPRHREVPELRPWPSLQLPLALAAALLLAILIVPILGERRTRALRREIAEVYTPTRDYVDDVELALVRAMSALRGFIITGDERFIAEYQAARAAEIRAYDRFRPAIRRLDPAQADTIEAMRRTTERWHEAIAERIAQRRAAPPAAGARIPVEEELYRRALASAANAERVVTDAREQNWQRITALDQRHAQATVVLTALALVVVAIMGWVGRQVRRLARRLERRAREEVAVRNLARDLAAAGSPNRVAEIAADGARALTGSAGAFIEHATSPQEPVEVVGAVGRGAPLLHTRVPYPGSLTRKMVETGEPEFFAAARDLTGPMAASILRTCGDCAVLIIPLGPLHHPLGTLVLLRGPDERPLPATEIGAVRIAADFAALALWRALLLEETERRREEAEASEQRYRSLFTYSPDAVLETDPDRRLRHANPAAIQIFGYPPDELLGLDWLKAIVPADRERISEAFRKALAGEPQQFEMTFIRKDGRAVEIQGTKLPIVVRGRNIGVFTIGSDVTERRRYERALREANQRLEAVIDASPLAIVVLDTKGRVRRWNPAAEEILGWTQKEVIGRLPPQAYGESADEFRHHFGRVMRGEALRGIEIRRRRKDGSLLTLRLSTAPLRDAEGRVDGVLAMLEDITARQRAEAALRETTEILETLVEASPLAIIVHDFDDVVRLWNPAAELIFGWKAEEVVGRKLPIIPEEERQAHREAVRRGFEGKSFTGEEVTAVRKDGTTVSLSLSTAPLRDSEGRIHSVVMLMFDITRRKRAEAERNRLLEREQAARAEAEQRGEELERVMESKARLIRGFSHDLKNPLGAVAGFAELLETGAKGELTSEQRESVSRIRRASRSMLDLIGALVELSRAEAGQIRLECKPADPGELVRDSTEEHRAAVEAAGLTLEVAIAPDLPTVVTDHSRVHQILGNLLSNATRYTPPGGRITVRVEVRTDGRAPRPGRWLAVDVSDTGPGIPRDMYERIFEEFARLEPGTPGGVGLGLPISRRLARLLGGDITVESEVGHGSTFTLWLPLDDEPHAPAS